VEKLLTGGGDADQRLAGLNLGNPAAHMNNVIESEIDTPSGPASWLTKEHPDTLKAKALRGEIEYLITPSGRWLFNIRKYMAKRTAATDKRHTEID
jgi:hypothetical protein